MTNIEKLYELAGIKKVGKKYSCKTLDFGACRTPNCDICDKAQDKNYPPFTDTKQLELIKWLSIQRNGFLVLNPTDNKKEFLVGTNYYWGRCDTQTKKLQDFSQALAGLVCELWEELTEQQREEVRGILE